MSTLRARLSVAAVVIALAPAMAHADEAKPRRIDAPASGVLPPSPGPLAPAPASGDLPGKPAATLQLAAAEEPPKGPRLVPNRSRETMLVAGGVLMVVGSLIATGAGVALATKNGGADLSFGRVMTGMTIGFGTAGAIGVTLLVLGFQMPAKIPEPPRQVSLLLGPGSLALRGDF